MILINDKPVPIRPYSIGELAQIYQVDYRTFKKWIAPLSHLLGEKIGRFYSIPQVEIIFANLKVPTNGIENLSKNSAVYLDPVNNIKIILPDQPPSITPPEQG